MPALDEPPDIDVAAAELRAAIDAPCNAVCRAAAERAALLLDQAWVNLPPEPLCDRAPLAAARRLAAAPPGTTGSFYRDLLAVFAAGGDRHTDCYLPDPFGRLYAFVPFMVQEEFTDGGVARLVVTGSAVRGLSRGDILVSWNGIAVDEVLEQHGRQQLGANPAARRAKAVQTLTFRPLAWLPPPHGTAILEATTPGGRTRTTRCQWRVAGLSEANRQFGDWRPRTRRDVAREGVAACVIPWAKARFGYIGIVSFQAPWEQFARTFLAALDDMPRTGLIIDLRGCEQGVIANAERLLQVLTHRKVEPQRFQFRVTELMLRIVRRSPALVDWRPGMETAAARGARFAPGRPLTDPIAANSIGQRYRGPVVILVDALTYSSAEMFTAGFQDHGIGRVIGAAPSTGGGGASIWWQSTLYKLSGDEMLAPCASAPTFRVAVRRGTRVGANAGRLVEGTGIVPDVVRPVTARDLTEDSADLIAYACQDLALR